MKVDTRSMRMVFVGAAVLMAAGSVFAYPPDNASVLYYRAFIIFSDPNESVDKILRDVAKGDIAANESVRKYLDENRYALDCVETATGVEGCDWGLDLSEGIELMMHPLAKFRQVAYMLASDARLLIQAGDYQGAMEKCLRLHRMARHAGDETIISCLVGRAINNLANERIVDVLSEMSADVETLMWLKGQIVGAKQRVPSFKSALANELEIFVSEIRKDRIDVVLENLGMNPETLSEQDRAKIEQVRREDESFFARSRACLTDYWTAAFGAYELPYPQSFEQLNSLNENLAKSAAEKPEAGFAKMFAPALTKIRTRDAEGETFFNALIAAIEVYIVKAKTGSLPDELPSGLPKDMFSGENFQYEQTADGFVLLPGQGPVGR